MPVSLSKVEDFIDSLPEGYSNYVKISLDPFHDKTIKFEGAPTSRSATSVVLCINQERTIAADDFPAVTEETWDAHVALYPFINKTKVAWAREINAVTAVSNSPEWEMFPLTVHGVNSGRPTYCVDNITNNLQTLGLDVGNVMNYDTGATEGPGRRTLRIVGSSFEVVNESPDIYTQGACTVYRYPLNSDTIHRWITTFQPAGSQFTPDTSFPSDFSENLAMQKEVIELRPPPTNQPSAVLVPGSVTWKAKEGCYVTATQYQNEIPFKTVTNGNLLFTGYPPTVGVSFDSGSEAYSFADYNVVRLSQGVFGVDQVVYPPNFSQPVNAVFPFNLSGAYFTGLSKTYTVLRLRYKVFVEILTDPCDNTLAPLATPTIPYNQTTQELVMRALAHMPAGVPQSWNPAGEQWKNALSIIGSLLTASAVPANALLSGLGPVLSGLGGAATAASLLIDTTSGKGRKRSNRASSRPSPAPKARARSRPAPTVNVNVTPTPPPTPRGRSRTPRSASRTRVRVKQD